MVADLEHANAAARNVPANTTASIVPAHLSSHMVADLEHANMAASIVTAHPSSHTVANREHANAIAIPGPIAVADTNPNYGPITGPLPIASCFAYPGPQQTTDGISNPGACTELYLVLLRPDSVAEPSPEPSPEPEPEPSPNPDVTAVADAN